MPSTAQKSHLIASTWSPAKDKGLIAWYEVYPTAVTNDDPGITDVVSKLLDLSGNGFNVIAAGSARPAYSAATGPNNTPVLVGDGSNTVLTKTSFTGVIPNECLAVHVASMSAGDTDQAVFEIGNGMVNTGIQYLYDSAQKYSRVVDVNGMQSVTVTEALPNSAKIRSMVYDGATDLTLKAFENGTQIGSTTTPVGALANALSVLTVMGANATGGSAYRLKGSFSALIISTSVELRKQYETYFNRKYGVY